MRSNAHTTCRNTSALNAISRVSYRGVGLLYDAADEAANIPAIYIIIGLGSVMTPKPKVSQPKVAPKAYVMSEASITCAPNRTCLVSTRINSQFFRYQLLHREKITSIQYFESRMKWRPVDTNVYLVGTFHRDPVRVVKSGGCNYHITSHPCFECHREGLVT